VDPAFFHALRRQLPTIGRVEVQLKCGQRHNELTHYRYDVILHVRDDRDSDSGLEVRDWQAQPLSLADVRRLLEEHAALRLKRVPNARLMADLKALELLSAPGGPSTADDLRAAVRDADPAGLDPDEFRDLAQDLGYEIEVRWSETGCDG